MSHYFSASSLLPFLELMNTARGRVGLNTGHILLSFCLPLCCGPVTIHYLISLSTPLGSCFLIFYPVFLGDLYGMIGLNQLVSYCKKCLMGQVGVEFIVELIYSVWLFSPTSFSFLSQLASCMQPINKFVWDRLSVECFQVGYLVQEY